MGSLDPDDEATRLSRELRIAFIVYNDVHGDSRVLKVAKTLEQAGASVRVFAASSDQGRYPDGLDRTLDDLDIYRLPPLALQRWARRLRGRSPAVIATKGVEGGNNSSTIRKPYDHRDNGLHKQISVKLAALYAVTVQWLFWRRIVEPIVSWGPDVVHAHDANTLPAAVAASRQARAKLLYDSHELWTDRNVARPRPFRDWLDKRVERKGVDRADGIITVSPSIARYLQDRYNLAVAPTVVRNIPRYDGNKIATRKLRELSQLTDEEIVVAYCGSITTNRGVEATIEALRYLDTGTHFVLLGEGQATYIERLRSLAKTLGVGERVHFVGRVPSADVATTLADADVSVVFTVPICKSYLWSLPNKLFESIHAGVPIVASDIPDVANLVSEFEVGLTTPLDDIELLSESIRSAIAGRERFRANAQTTAQSLNWQSESRKLLELYEVTTGHTFPR